MEKYHPKIVQPQSSEKSYSTREPLRPSAIENNIEKSSGPPPPPAAATLSSNSSTASSCGSRRPSSSRKQQQPQPLPTVAASAAAVTVSTTTANSAVASTLPVVTSEATTNTKSNSALIVDSIATSSASSNVLRDTKIEIAGKKFLQCLPVSHYSVCFKSNLDWRREKQPCKNSKNLSRKTDRRSIGALCLEFEKTPVKTLLSKRVY